MTQRIAIAGKGGTGKTTFAALLIQLLIPKGTVLAIDADPSTNLHMALDLPLGPAVGDIREGMLLLVKKGQFSPGMAKSDYLELKVQEALVESQGVDLLIMGRPEGPGCYCAANEILRNTIERLSKNYDFVVVDCEAGMEHLSRHTAGNVDSLILLTDLSQRSLVAARRMKELVAELKTKVGRVGVVVNRLGNGLPPVLEKGLAEAGLELWGVLPDDEELKALEAQGKAVVKLPASSPLRQSVSQISHHLGI
mgnify:FL=1